LIEAGQIVLLRFPYADARGGKLRPALVLARLPGPYDDWLVSMISSRLHQAIRAIDEIVLQGDADFAATGLKTASVVRVTRLAVVASDRMEGALGRLSTARMTGICKRLADWLATSAPSASDD